MRTVRDDDGRRLLVLEERADRSLVRDPETGDERFVPNDALEPVASERPDDAPDATTENAETDGETPKSGAETPRLDALAAEIPEDARRVVTACHDDWLLGLLVDLADRGPLPAREMLRAYDACESDLLGGVTELRVAGLVEETTVAGEPCYALTDSGHRGVAALRE